MQYRCPQSRTATEHLRVCRFWPGRGVRFAAEGVGESWLPRTGFSWCLPSLTDRRPSCTRRVPYSIYATMSQLLRPRIIKPLHPCLQLIKNTCNCTAHVASTSNGSPSACPMPSPTNVRKVSPNPHGRRLQILPDTHALGDGPAWLHHGPQRHI